MVAYKCKDDDDTVIRSDRTLQIKLTSEKGYSLLPPLFLTRVDEGRQKGDDIDIYVRR